MILLDKNRDYVAEGMYQVCYRHPESKDLCIKISKPDAIRDRVQKELKYYKQLNKRRSLKNKKLVYSKYIETVTTNFGQGLCYEFITDEKTGDVSKTLEHYLMYPDPNIPIALLQKKYEALINYLISNRIMALDLWAKNICCQRKQDGTVNLLIIDGLGHRDFLPLVNWFSYFTKKKLHRRMIRNHMTTLQDQHDYLKSKNS